MPQNPDAITALCTFLRDAGLTDNQLMQVDQMLIEVIAQATNVSAASISMDQEPRVTYRERFPNSGRLAVSSHQTHQV